MSILVLNQKLLNQKAVIVHKVAGQGSYQLGKSRVHDSQPVSHEPKERAIFLATQPVEDSFDDARVQKLVARWRLKKTLAHFLNHFWPKVDYRSHVFVTFA